MRKFYCAFLCALFFAMSCFAQKTYIQCGRLIDGISNTSQTEMTIVVEGKTITSVQKGYTSGSSADKVIDLKNKTVMPGLIDCHVHLENEHNKNTLIEGFTLTDADVAYHAAVYAKRTLMAGFTTVRDLGGSGVNISLRKAIRQGLVDGPRIITAGQSNFGQAAATWIPRLVSGMMRSTIKWGPMMVLQMEKMN